MGNNGKLVNNRIVYASHKLFLISLLISLCVILTRKYYQRRTDHKSRIRLLVKNNNKTEIRRRFTLDKPRLPDDRRVRLERKYIQDTRIENYLKNKP